jgi:2-keto-4-pentenoate hydratase/2-oxohepta-3-ene-1,7-dioic acid hydratase in catechol pathway
MSISETWMRLFERPAPAKIVCVGLNYRPHAAESNFEVPDQPLLFAKFANTLVDPGEAIELPRQAEHVDAEAELACVIGRRIRDASADEALEAVYGYTAANDVSARDLQFGDGQWFRGKGFDTFCPLLPDIVPVGELGAGSGLRVVQRLNGDVLQDGSTDDLIFDVPTLVAFVSGVMTLEPGDVILTGTPEGVGYFRTPRIALAHGDEVEVEVEGVGILRNHVVDRGR